MVYFIKISSVPCQASSLLLCPKLQSGAPASQPSSYRCPDIAFGDSWLWRDTGDAMRIASHAEATFWYVLPSLPMFLVLPAMLRAGFGFWPSMGANCLLTIALYFATVWAAAKLGISLGN